MKSSTGESVTLALCREVAGGQYEDVSEEVRELTKAAILDSMGCAIGGGFVRPGQAVLNTFAGLGGYPEATVLATGARIPALHAAYVNSYLSNVLDYDDTDLGHPGCCVIPPTLAMAEMAQATGAQFITAVAWGYEIYARVAAAIYPSNERDREIGGRSSTQLLGIIGGTVGTGRLLRFTPDRLATALGVAVASAPVPLSLMGFVEERPLSWVKNNAGWGAMGAVLSAKLAEQGFVASRSSLDHSGRFWQMSGSDRCDEGQLLAPVDGIHGVLRLSFKPYPRCRYIHTTLDALREALAAGKIRREEVELVEVRGFSRLGGMMDARPTTVFDAQFSIPHSIAMVLLGWEPGYGWLDESSLGNEAVLAKADLVQFTLDTDAERMYFERRDRPRYPVTVRIVADGQAVERKALVPRGDPANPMSWDDLAGKFVALAAPILDEESAQQIVQIVRNLECCQDVAELVALCRRANKADGDNKIQGR